MPTEKEVRKALKHLRKAARLLKKRQTVSVGVPPKTFIDLFNAPSPILEELKFKKP